MESTGNEAERDTKTRPWLTPEGAVEYLRERYRIEYTVKSIYRKAAAGQLPAYRPPGSNALRFDPDELDAWVRGDWTPEPDTEPAEAVG